jgi:hypothetical protein
MSGVDLLQLCPVDWSSITCQKGVSGRFPSLVTGRKYSGDIVHYSVQVSAKYGGVASVGRDTITIEEGKRLCGSAPLCGSVRDQHLRAGKGSRGCGCKIRETLPATGVIFGSARRVAFEDGLSRKL